MVEVVFRIGWFLMGWTAAFSCLMLGYLGWQIYLGSRR